MSGAWDFLVAGAGPAGSRAAELLAHRGARVLMLDPKAPWEKPCGGGLSAAALAHTPDLAELAGEWETIADVLMMTPGGARVILPLRCPFVVVSRLALSRWGLARSTGAGATFLPVALRSVERAGGLWRVTDGRGGVHRARWLVGADGAASRLRQLLAPGLRPGLAPARMAYPARGAPSGRAAFVLFPGSRGYLWDFPRVGPHSVGVTVERGAMGRGALDYALHGYLRDAAPGGEHLPVRGAAVAMRSWRGGRYRDLGSAAYALLGDAAGLSDPLTGEGIDYALRSASLAVGTFDQDRGFEGYPRALRRSLRSDGLRARLLLRFIYRPGVVNRLVRDGGRPGFARAVLCALMNAVNEHGSLAGAVREIVTAVRAPGREGARGEPPRPVPGVT